MPVSGNTHSLPAGVLVTNGQTADASQHNPGFTDLSAGVTEALARDAGKELVGVAASLDAAHVAATDPHPQYLLSASGNGPLGTPMSADKGRAIFLGNDALIQTNREELAAWYNALLQSQALAISTGATNTDIGFVLGDSKAGYGLDGILDTIALARGFPSVNFGAFSAGGKNSYHMLNTLLPSMLANVNWVNTKLVILNFGTNQQVNGGVDSPNRTAAQTDADVRAIIARMRDTAATPAGRDQSNLSIVIMGQTPANNPANGQTNELMRELNVIYRKIADDTNCMFFDAFAQYSRPHADANWMDDIDAGAPVVSVHPLATFNAMLANDLAEAIMPSGFAARYGLGDGNSTVFNLSADLPSTYPIGRSSHRAVVANGYPVDGVVETLRTPSRIVTQLSTSRVTGGAFSRASNGAADVWTAWVPLSGYTRLEITPDAAWTQPATEKLRTKLQTGACVTMEGYLDKTVPGAVAAGTVIGTIPVGHRPFTAQWRLKAASFAGTWNDLTVDISSAGVITTSTATVHATSRIYVQSATWSTE